VNNSAILLVTCPDRRGIVASISDFIFRHNGNILHADEHADEVEMGDGRSLVSQGEHGINA
jgi:formyltetrahydrofolate hydrolase